MKAHPFLRDLAPSMIDDIAACSTERDFAAGEFLLREGEEADSSFLILSGRVALEIYTPTRGTTTIETLGEGGVVGWSWLIPPHRWHLDARATAATHAIVVDGTALLARCEQDPRLGYELMKRYLALLQRRVESMRLQLADAYGTASV